MEVFIDKYRTFRHVEVYLKDERGNNEIYFSYDGEKLEETEIPFDSAELIEVKPLLRIPQHYFQSLVTAFINEGEKMNIRTENENHLRGKLEATETHLKDLQKISKKLLKIDN